MLEISQHPAEIPLMVPLAELQRRSKRSRATLYRWLKRKNVRTFGYGVMISDLMNQWPAMYLSLTQAVGGKIKMPPCTECGGPTTCKCLACEATVF